MSVNGMKIRTRILGPLVALTLAGLSLTGCVVYPHAGYGYGYSSYYYEPAYVAPPPVVVFGGGWGWHDHDDGDWGGGHHWR
jgi:hypothetical protein